MTVEKGFLASSDVSKDVNREIKDSAEALKTANREIKDSVFTDLFRDKANLRKLYATFYDDEAEYTDDDFQILTLSPVLANTVYNDLGFIVGDRLIVLVEEQSNFNPNMPIRMLIYAAYTYQGYIKEKKLNLYSSKRIEIPRADFIVIHTFDGSIEQGKDMKLSDSYIDKGCWGDVSLELKVKVAGKEIAGSGIVYEYIRFCQIYKEKSSNAKTKAEKLEALRKTIAYCKENDVLREYLEKKECEVSGMMMSLYSQEEINEMFIEEAREEGISIGEERGRNEGISIGEARGLREGVLNTARKMLSLGAKVAFVEKATGLSIEDIQEITNLSAEELEAL